MKNIQIYMLSILAIFHSSICYSAESANVHNSFAIVSNNSDVSNKTNSREDKRLNAKPIYNEYECKIKREHNIGILAITCGFVGEVIAIAATPPGFALGVWVGGIAGGIAFGYLTGSIIFKCDGAK